MHNFVALIVQEVFTVQVNIMGKILLEGMEFFAFHGCFREEQIIGTKFRVDLEIEADTRRAEETDHLRETVDYVSLYQAVKSEMEQKSHLLEHVGRRILDRISRQFPAVTYIRLKIAKNNPPMGGKMDQVCFVTEWQHTEEI